MCIEGGSKRGVRLEVMFCMQFCMLFCMLEAVEDEFCLLEVP